MTLFVGGPYDGRDLEFNPELGDTVRLPDVEEWDSEGDPQATLPRKCPYTYKFDRLSDPPCFRIVTDTM